MLSDVKAFERIESILNEDGTIESFEKENGKILGRMMIDLCEIPDNLKDSTDLTDSTYAFRGTFDFYDAALGIALDVRTLEAKSGIWVVPQSDHCDGIVREWIEYFIETLMKGIGDGFGVPMYAFVNDSSSFEIYPNKLA